MSLEQRALAAYFKYSDAASGLAMQPSSAEIVEHSGLKYVRLSNVNGILAIYRVRVVNGEQVLKRLKRWPGELGGR